MIAVPKTFNTRGNPVSMSYCSRCFLLVFAFGVSVAIGFAIPSSGHTAEPDKWESAIRKFEEADDDSPPKPGGVLFIGSSSVRRWELDESFPGKGYVNRGFGGSKIADSTRYVERIVVPHAPRLVVMFVGDNDIAAGREPEQLAADFKAFTEKIHSHLPKTHIVYLAVKPSIKRWSLYPKMAVANKLLSQFIASDARLTFIDVATPMLGEDGKPKTDLLHEDKLHLSPKGYELWTSLLNPHLNAGHRLAIQGNNKLAIVGKTGRIEWEMKWGGIHDIHVFANGHIMVQEGMRKVVEIDPKTKSVVWSYDSTKQNGNQGKRIEVHAFQPLPNGNVMIAESGAGRIIEVDRDGKLVKEIKLKIDKPHPHRDTRLVRKLANGNYLVCHEGDGAVREYDDETGKVVWDYDVPLFGKQPKGGHGIEAFGNQAFAAVRLANGNTLVATGNGHSVLEVSPEKKIVWQLHQNDLPDITLAWVTTLEVLPNGNYVIGNCHAGPDNPLLIEIEPKSKKVVWTFDQFNVFGNSVPNSQLLDIEGAVIR
jgi:lysophospholipase L1-like esterase